MLKFARALALASALSLALLPPSARAQTPASGSVMANDTAAAAPMKAVTPTSWMNRWCGSTAGFIPYRGASSWSCAAPGATSGVQPYDADLAALAGLTSANNKCFYWTGSGTAANYDCSSFGRGVSNAADATALRVLAGTVIGTDVQAFNAKLAAIAGLTVAADKLQYWTGTSSATTIDFLTWSRSFVSAADTSAARASLGVAIGTNVQAYSALLASIAGTTVAQHDIIVATAAATVTNKSIPDCTDTSGNHLNYTRSTQTFSCGTSSSGGGGIDDTLRRNILLTLVYQSKSFAGYRREIHTFADGFKASDGINSGSSTNYSVDTSNGRVAPSSSGGYTPSYANSGGTGSRTGSVTVTTTLSLAGGTITNLVDGTQTDDIDPTNSQSVSGLYVRFDFGSGQSKVITEAKFYASAANAEGNFKWQGSNDASAWTDVSAAFSMLGSSGGSVVGDMSANAAGYRYYRILGTSGSTFGPGGPFWREFEFKIDNYSAVTTGNMTVVTTSQTADSSVSNGRVLIEYNPVDSITLNTDLTADVSCKFNATTVTISNASPGVISHTSHGLAVNDPVYFTTSGALPTGLTASTVYFVKTVADANSYTVSATPGGSAINTSSAGSGTHTANYFRWAAASFSSVGTAQAGRTVAETADTACVESGTTFAARLKSLNNKSLQNYGLSLTVH